MAWLGKRRSIPDGLWMKCDACNQMVYKREVEQALWVCTKCQYHFSLSAPQRIRLLLDEAEGVGGANVGVGLGEGAFVEEEADALGGGEGEVVLALGADP